MCSLMQRKFLTLLKSSRKFSAHDTVKVAGYAAQALPVNDQDRQVNTSKPTSKDEGSLPDYRFVYPEFLPDPNPAFRNKLREKLERMDMIKRRVNIDIPEFYVGSILAVTVADINSPTKTNRFVGICIERSGCGLRASCVLRNVVDGYGIEIRYELYNPLLRSIEVLKLEKRLDDTLFYLRDAAQEYSTFSFDMEAEPRAEGAPVPVNPLMVQLKPLPWSVRWERENLRGVMPFEVTAKRAAKAVKFAKPWEKYDLMKTYRATITEEEQTDIYSEVAPRLQELEAAKKKTKRRSKFSQFSAKK